MNAQDKRAHNAEALQELKAIANALPALATKVDVIVRLERAERMAATINRIIQTHAADAAHTRIPDLTDDEWMILFHERPDLKDRLNAIFDKAAYLSRYRSQCKTSTEAAQAQAQSGEWVMVPREPTEWMLQAAEDAVNAAAHCESTTDDLSAIAYKAALAAAPQQAAEPVGHARTDGCMHFAYLPWSVKDGDPVYAAPPAERVQEKAEPVAEVSRGVRVDGVLLHEGELNWLQNTNRPAPGTKLYTRPPAQAQAQSGECQRNSPAGCDCIDTCVAISQPQAAEPVAVIESAEDRHGPYLTHANVVLRVWNGYVPKAGDEIYTHPQPPAQSGASKFVHSSPESRQAVLERVAERATQAQLEQSAQCAKDAARGIDARGHGAAPAGGP